MYVFNEGLPRSGKSYDTVVNHILPALRAGRKVYACLKGLDDPGCRAKIAEHIGLDTASLDALLIYVPKVKVRETFVAVTDDKGEWVIPDHLVDSLFVIDEIHDYYVASRQPIPPEQENFFALHGQFGMDGVIMTQSIKRTHSSVRYRIERKNVFQKLTAVGLEGKFTVRRYHAIGPDKFELVATETGTYEPIYFPMYKGYGDKAKQKGVYKAGGVTVWKKLRRYGLVMAVFVGVGLWAFLRVFSGDGGFVKQAPRVGAAPHTVSGVERAAPVAAPMLPTSQHPSVDTKGMPPEVAYLFELSGQARARLAASLAGPDGKAWGVIEWREDQGHVLDSLTFDQVRSLGVAVWPRPFGVKLTWKDKAIVVTAWPLDMPGTVAAANQPQGSAPAVAAPAAADQGAGQGQATAWPREPVVSAYVPPELVKAPPMSSWSP